MDEGIDALPGGDLVASGLRDLAAGVESVPALLVAIAAPRLRRLGLRIPPGQDSPVEPERRLYGLLCQEEGKGAYSRYNSLLRRLISFEQALEREHGRRLRPGQP